MADVILTQSKNYKARADALKRGDDAPRQKYTRLFWTDSSGKITAFTIKLFERTASGGNGEQLAYTREQWEEIVNEKKLEMEAANKEASSGKPAPRDLFSGIAGFESSDDETKGVTFSIPSNTPPTAGSTTPPREEIIIQNSKNRARDFNLFAHAVGPRFASELSESGVSTDRSERASLPEWWDTKMTEPLTPDQIDAVLAAPSIGIRNDGTGNTCFFNTMFNAYILHDRELIDALLKHRQDEPTKRIANYLYNYIKYRTTHLDSPLAFNNTEQFRKDLHQIDPKTGYLTGQHDAGQAYHTLRGALEPPKEKGKVGGTGWLAKEKCTVTQRLYYKAPKATDVIYPDPITLDRPIARTAKEIFLRKPQQVEKGTKYHLHATDHSDEAFSENDPETQSSVISIDLSQKSKSPLTLEDLARDQYFSVREPENSEKSDQPICLKGKDGTILNQKTVLKPCKQLKRERILSGEPPKILIFEFDGSGEVTIPTMYTLPSAYMQKNEDGSDKPAVQYALKSATVRPGDSPLSGGHYFSYDKRGSDWYRTNDSVATKIGEDVMLDELKKTRRTLFYEQVDVPAPAVV
jgi:hypothetical protein